MVRIPEVGLGIPHGNRHEESSHDHNLPCHSPPGRNLRVQNRLGPVEVVLARPDLRESCQVDWYVLVQPLSVESAAAAGIKTGDG